MSLFLWISFGHVHLILIYELLKIVSQKGRSLTLHTDFMVAEKLAEM